MTSLVKLSIQGVRSYSDQSCETIEFFRPLTIIVGSNGSGKTSIIESLKLVCTGTQPPLSDGGKSFIYDPRLCHSPMVKAQIRLSFRTENDQKAVLAMRSFQLTQKKTKREFKAMESVLKLKNLQTNEEQSITSRCADMDKLVPQLMGVSSAVVENVIFVHQEEANWPLGDAKSLKTKFDDIFAATRYTKALETIAKLKKEKAAEHKDMESEIKVLSAHLTQSQKLEDDLRNHKETIAAAKGKSEELNKKIADLETKISHYESHAKEFKFLQQKIDDLLAQRSVLESERLKANDKMQNEYDDPDDALMMEYQNFKERKRILQGQIEDKQQKSKAKQRESQEMEREMHEVIRKIGVFESQQEEYKKKISTLSTHIHRLSSLYDIHRQFPSLSHSQDFQEFVSILTEYLTYNKNELSNIISAARDFDKTSENEISNLKQKSAKLSESYANKRAIAAANAEKVIANQQLQIDIEAKLGMDMDIEGQILILEGKLSSIMSSDSSEKIKEKISSLQNTFKNNKFLVTSLQNERKTLSGQQESVSAIKMRSEQIKAKSAKHNDILAQIKREINENNIKIPSSSLPSFPLPLPNDVDELLQIVDSSPSSSSPSSSSPLSKYHSESIEKSLSTYLSSLRDDLSRSASSHSSLRDKLNSIDSQLKQCTDQRDQMEKTLLSLRDEWKDNPIVNSFDNDQLDFDFEIKKLNDKLQRTTKDNATLAQTEVIYDIFLTKGDQQHACPLCLRKFADESEKKEFLEINKNKMDNLITPEAKKDLQMKLERIQNQLTNLQKFHPAYLEFRKIHGSEMTQMEIKISKLLREKDNLITEVTMAESKVSFLTKQEDLCSKIHSSSTHLSRHYNEIMDLSKVVLRDRQLLSSISVGGRTLDLVLSEMDQMESQQTEIQKEISELQEKTSTVQNQRAAIQSDLSKLKDKKVTETKLRSELDNCKKIEQEIRLAHEKNNKELKSLGAEREPIGKQIEEFTVMRNEKKKEFNERESEKTRRVSDIEREISTFHRILSEMKSFESDIQQRERDIQSQIESKKRMEILQNEVKSLVEEAAEGAKQMANLQIEDEDIRANIEFRKRTEELRNHDAKIAELKSSLSQRQLSLQTSNNVGADQQKLSALREKRAELTGSLKAIEKNCTTLIGDLLTPQYKNISRRYTKHLIHSKALQKGISDLENYYKSLDKALMAFHTIKMREINEVLKDYWRTVYKGKDIEEIYIKSSQETDNARRSYTYSVMMRQGDTELEMRGRCSAGQRVLASLLIRLSLADTFCVQCGILALDEPTTNLDSKNISAFASALNEILEKRRQQSNFQLIVITHDETFVEEIGKRAHADYYYRVFKDAENHSKIRKQRLAMEGEAEE